MEIKFNDSEKFVEELLKKITDTGFNAMSKNDLYDYILHLFDKFSEDNFLSTRSNFENAVYFKVTEQKIKNSKLNINLKYRQTDPIATITKFLAGLNTKSIKQTKDGNFEFVIDDYYIRMCLEDELKKHGDTFEYRNNSEKVEIRKESLIKLLTSYNEELSKKIKTQALLKTLVGLILQFTEKSNTDVVLFEQLKDVGSKILKEIKNN